MKALTKRKFGTLPHDQQFHDELTKAGLNSSGIQSLVGMGLSWWQIIMLAIQFFMTPGIGTNLTSIVTDIINLFKTSGTDPAALLVGLEALAVQYGPAIYQMAALIASWLGVTLPPLPAKADDSKKPAKK